MDDTDAWLEQQFAQEDAVRIAKEAFGLLKAQWYLNHYQCSECDQAWTDEWSCACDDDCPMCGTTMTPVESEDIEDDG